MRDTTIISEYVMRFLRIQVDSERNDKVSSNDAYDVFTIIPRIQLGGLKQAVYPPRCLKYRSSKQVAVQKFQDDSSPFRMCIDFFLLHNDWIARFRAVKRSRSLKYLTITTITHGLENKVVSTETSIFPNIFKGGGKV
jgi:hypothetical protein